MDNIKGDISLVYNGYIVRHIYQVRFGWSMKAIITKAMMEVEKNYEICGSVIVPPDWISEIRKWGMSCEAAGFDYRTGYFGVLYGANFYIDTGLAPDEMAILVHGEHDRILHIFRLVLNVI